ncbi:MAG: hypothetical protein MUO31_12790 [Thermodesulfovibrionales bacterium]|nr:hypothetical protein [Thermodesulfovibrionales bacterium]
MKNFKNLVLFIFILFTVQYLGSITPKGALNLTDSDSKAKDIGPKNWAIGVQAYYDLSGGQFAENFQASALALLETFSISDEFNIFFMGNLSSVIGNSSKEDIIDKIKEIQQTSQGINLAFYPHWYKTFTTKLLKSITIYTPIGWKLNAFKNDVDIIQYLHQFNGSIGIEFALLEGSISKKPITISIEGKLTKFSKTKYESIFGEQKSSLTSLEITAVIPILNGCGIAVNYLNSKEIDPIFSVGLIIVNSN